MYQIAIYYGPHYWEISNPKLYRIKRNISCKIQTVLNPTIWNKETQNKAAEKKVLHSFQISSDRNIHRIHLKCCLTVPNMHIMSFNRPPTPFPQLLPYNPQKFLLPILCTSKEPPNSFYNGVLKFVSHPSKLNFLLSFLLH